VIAHILVLLTAVALAAPPRAVVTTIAGAPGIAGYWDGPAADAMFAHPTWLDAAIPDRPNSCEGARNGEIYVVDRINQLIRRIDPSGNVTTVPTARPLDFGSAFGGGIVVEPPGAGCGCGIYGRGMFVVNSGARQITLYSPDGKLASRDFEVVIGSGREGADDGDIHDAAFRAPVGVARAAKVVAGNNLYLLPVLYVADSGNHTIRRVRSILSLEGCPLAWDVTTIAGAAGQPGFADGAGAAARFDTPRGIAALPDGTLYVTDAGNHVVRKITPDGVVTTVAGTPGVAGSDDTHLNTPSGIDVDANGNVYVVDTFNHAVRMIGSDGKLVTVAGQLGVSGFADGDAATAKFNAPVGLKVAPDGSLVIADTGNNVIRRVTLQ